jgi:selenide,water dikinase
MDTAQQRAWLQDCLAAVQEVAAEAGAALVGGHTTMGAELTIGFTVTGLLQADALTLDGAQPGDVLITTRPIGSGTLLAGEMKGAAKGADIAGLIGTMCRSPQQEARVLAGSAHALTDVTGFGLAGHIGRMADASDLTVELDLSAVTFYPGAVQLAQSGVRSTIFEANRAAVAAILPDDPRAALLFDPQTAGGFAAAVPHDKAQAVLRDLRRVAPEAAIIGRFMPRRDGPLQVRV